MFCRLCGEKENEESIDIFENKYKSLSKKIKTLLNIHIRPKDEYQSVCLDCSQKIESFYNYYVEVQKFQTNLKSKLIKEKKKKEAFVPIYPKEEIEDNDDSVADSFTGLIELKTEPDIIIEDREVVKIKQESVDDFSDAPCDDFDEEDDDDNDKDSQNESKPFAESESKRQEYKELSEKINKFYDFNCKKCELDLGNPFGYQLHMKRKHKILNASITCCDVKIPSIRKDLLYHFYTHTNLGAILCKYCGKQCSSMHYLKKHEQNHIERITKSSQVPCPHCGKQMQNKISLRNHIKNVHAPIEEKEKFECDICHKIIFKKSSLRNHFRITHKIGAQPPKKDHGDPVLCPMCAKSFQTEAGFKCHFKAHHDVTNVTCPECGREVNKLSLKNHMRRLHDYQPQVCDICFKEFKNMHAVLHHKNRVHIERRHECDLCEKKFKTKEKLRDHRKIHFVQNRFHCDMCNVTCNDYSNILKHRKQVHQAPPLPKGMGRKILEIGF